MADIDTLKPATTGEPQGISDMLLKRERMMIYWAAVRLGSALPHVARPFYVAAILPLSRIDGDIWPFISSAIGVSDFTDTQKLCTKLVMARANGDAITAAAVIDAIDSAGCYELALQGIGCAYRLAEVLEKLPKRMPDTSLGGVT
jgi:hypothetical protein